MEGGEAMAMMWTWRCRGEERERGKEGEMQQRKRGKEGQWNVLSRPLGCVGRRKDPLCAVGVLVLMGVGF